MSVKKSLVQTTYNFNDFYQIRNKVVDLPYLEIDKLRCFLHVYCNNVARPMCIEGRYLCCILFDGSSVSQYWAMVGDCLLF